MRVLGTYARNIHAIPTNGFGDKIEDFDTGHAQDGWLRFVDYNLGELATRARWSLTFPRPVQFY